MFLYYYFWFIFIPVNHSFKPDFNCSSSFILPWVDKVTIWTWSFVSVIVNSGSWVSIGLPIIKHLLDQVRIRLISQLVNGISRVLQKLLKYFHGTVL